MSDQYDLLESYLRAKRSGERGWKLAWEKTHFVDRPYAYKYDPYAYKYGAMHSLVDNIMSMLPPGWLEERIRIEREKAALEQQLEQEGEA